MQVSRIRLQQDLEYAQSLLADRIRELQLERNEQRQLVEQLLITKIPDPLEKMLTREQAQLVRVYRLQPLSLKPEERALAEKLVNQLSHWRGGGCFNLSSQDENILRQHNRLFTFSIPGTPVTFCIDVASPLEHELTNVELNLVDIFINVAPGERYRYPLNDEAATRFFHQVRTLGVDPARAPQMRFPRIEEAQEQIDYITLQMHQ